MTAILATCLMIAGQVPVSGELDPREELLIAQAATSQLESDTGSVVAASCGLLERDGQWRALGPRFKAELDGQQLVFTPALGSRAPRNYSLGYRLLDVARDGAPLLPRTAAGARTGERQLTVERSAVMDEVWDVRPDGIEHSVVLRALPLGGGDLVARIDVSTELPLASSDGARARFVTGELGGVSIDGVLGIDASGATARGSIAWTGGLLELRLPAAFVDGAALPLVIDPLIGVDITVASGFDASDPDVAYGDGRYLVAWEEVFSGSDSDIRAQRMGVANTFIGGTVDLQSGGDVAINPTVAFNNLSDTWLVAWQQGASIFGPWDIHGRGVRDNGVLIDSLVIASDVASEVDPDAGGERTTDDDDVLVVWEREGGGIRGAQVTLPVASSTPFVVSSFTVTTTSNDGRPAISKSGGDTGQYMVVWERLIFGFPFGDYDVVGRLFDRNGNALGAEAAIAATTIDELDPDVDGDGTRWMVAYEREEATGADFDIYCKTFESVGGFPTALTPATAVENDVNDDEVDPAVAWVPSKFAVAYADRASDFVYHVYVAGLDPATCAACESVNFVSGLSNFVQGVELAPRWAGGNTADEALLVWSSHDLDPPFDGEVRSQLYQAHTGGPVVGLGGGCGGGGAIVAQGDAAIGNQQFGFAVVAADPMAVIGFLNLSVVGQTPIVCGPCIWNPWQVTQTAGLSGGTGSVTTPVPCNASLAGVSLEAQWTVLFTASTPCSLSPNVSLTDRLQVTLQY